VKNYIKRGMDMIIGICDDEQIYLKDMEALCREYAEKTGKHCEIILFYSGEELLKNRVKLDILFLDIQMEGMNGLDTQELLWQRDGSSCFVVYMTNYSEYAAQAYNVNVIGFLYKPVTYDMAERMLNKAEINKKDLHVLLKCNGEAIRSRDILYLEAKTPYVKFYLQSGKSFLEQGPMQKWENKLKEYGFYRVHYSYIINMAYVREYKKEQVTLCLETKISISKRRFKEFKKAYEEYWKTRRERR